MRIGIISNSEAAIPLAYTLAAQKLQVYLFFSISKDPFVVQKVRGFAKQYNVPLCEEKSTEDNLYQWINRTKFDACFVIGYSRLIRLSKIMSPSPAMFNIHFGPLPAFKGPVPVFWQLKYGVENIGLAIHQLTEKFDDGPVVWTKEFPNRDFFNYEVVNQYLSNMSVEGVLFILNLLARNLPVLPLSVPLDRISSFQKRPQANDIIIKWDKMSAIEICNLVKACNPWNKGAITFFMGKEVKLMDAIIIKNRQNTTEPFSAGTIVNNEDHLHIKCCDGDVLNVNMLFFQNCFIPAYLSKTFGLKKNERFVDI